MDLTSAERAGHRLTGILAAYTHHTLKARDKAPITALRHTQKPVSYFTTALAAVKSHHIK